MVAEARGCLARQIAADSAQGRYRLEALENSTKLKELAYAESFGPAAIDALDGAEQVVQCSWAYPNADGVATVFVARLPTSTRERFVASLRDSVFIERTAGSAVIFEDHGPQRRKSMPVSYGFVEDLWVTHIGVLPLFEPVLRRTSELNLSQTS
ncbi:hypothetical protein [Leucobacter chromiiresistens]|uniref:Uncharacterized protein n=1 Tax=Leucobacter chromiiresistens TaxID=1079994 RepID=A0A147EP62_9MICO|nr:hypothetical protein [Leucobacter chromiiresistens]KTR86220.1 hypothetical protein NS354_05890 [Leucobacter chromiiresistens]